jgi:triosephosphate isomerase
MRTPLVAGNWKLNKTVLEAEELARALLPGLAAVSGVESLLCPPFTALSAVSRMLAGSDVKLGAQDVYWEASGAYTGEISPAMLAEFCQYVIIGHSERRAYFHETDATVNRKAKAALQGGLIPLVCVGETLEENEAGRAAEVVSRQVSEGLAGLPVPGGGQDETSFRLVIAYEPVWAIGTGKAATAEGADTLIRNVIRPTLAGLFGEEAARSIRVLYGGSVTPANAAEFFKMPEIDGALVGGASLKAPDFIGIAEAAA